MTLLSTIQRKQNYLLRIKIIKYICTKYTHNYHEEHREIKKLLQNEELQIQYKILYLLFAGYKV